MDLDTAPLTPVFRPKLPSYKDVSPILRRIDRTRVYSNSGPVAMLYKEELGNYLSIEPEKIVLTSSATTGLQGLIAISEHTRWECPDFSFAAPALSVLNAGKTLSLVDVSQFDWMVNRITTIGSKTGLMVVLPFGRKVGTAEIEGLPNVIIDAAASLGEVENGVKWLASSSAIVFSVHATKPLGAGEGGVVVCGSARMAAELSKWSNFGFDQRIADVVGTNAKMPEITAAYGLKSLENRSRELDDWRHLRETTRRLMSKFELPLSIFDNPDFYDVNPYWLVKLDTEKEFGLVTNALDIEKIEWRRWWPAPLSTMPAFKNISSPNSQTSTQLAARILGLPFFRGLSGKTAERIARIVAENRVS